MRKALEAGVEPARRHFLTVETALLVALKSIERAFGRKERFRYGPRELDLDLLLFGGTMPAALKAQLVTAVASRVIPLAVLPPGTPAAA